MNQEPTVLVRIYGRTRDRLDALRRLRYGDYGPKESFAAVIDQLTEEATAGNRKPAAKTSRRRRVRRKVKR